MLQIPQSLCTELTDEQASTVQGGLYVQLDKIQAIKAGADSRLFGPDDLYVTIDGKKVYGVQQFTTGKGLNVNAGSFVGSSGRIELFDEDNGFFNGKDDSLGGFTVSSSTNGKQVRQRVSGGGSIYDVYFQAT